MKVTGETFSFILKRRGAEEERYRLYRNFQAKGLLLDRTLESFIKKAPTGQFLILGINLRGITYSCYSKWIKFQQVSIGSGY